MIRAGALFAAVSLAVSACGGGAKSPVTPSSSGIGTAGARCSTLRVGKPISQGYANTTWPNDRGDAWRTGAVAAGLPASIRSSLRTVSATLPPAPTLGSVGLDGNLYVLGGAPFVQDVFTNLILGAPHVLTPLLVARSLLYARTVTPYIARINPSTMSVNTLKLANGANHSVNYIGSILEDSNGYLYAVAQGFLYKIDPKTMSVVASKQLPLATDSHGKPNALTAYNGLGADLHGDLILHGFPMGGAGSNILLMVDPANLSIKAQLESTDVSIARPTIVSTDGHEPEYLYMPAQNESKRYLLTQRGFILDDAFTQRYLFPSDNGAVAAGADIFMGRGIVFVDNGDFKATVPMTIFAQSASKGARIQAQPAFPGAQGAGWYLFGQAGDPFHSGIEALHNSVTGHIAGFSACAGGTSVHLLWVNDRIQGSAGMAIDYAHGQLYADDHQCTGSSWRTKTCKLWFVVLDLRTGKEIVRTRVAGSKPSNAQIFVGPNNAVFYVAGESGEPHGYITRITAQ